MGPEGLKQRKRERETSGARSLGVLLAIGRTLAFPWIETGSIGRF